MKKSRILALMLAAGMAVMSVPMPVYAEGNEGYTQEEGLKEAVLIDGKLKIKGDPYIGTELEADLTEVTPSDLEADRFDYQWVRWIAEGEDGTVQYEVLGKEKKFTLTEAVYGEYIGLILTPKLESGLAGELTYYFEDPVLENPNPEGDLISEESSEALSVEEENWDQEEWAEDAYGLIEENWTEESQEEENGWVEENSTELHEQSASEESTWEQNDTSEDFGFEISNVEEVVYGADEPENEVFLEEPGPAVRLETDSYDLGSWDEDGLADVSGSIKLYNDGSEEITVDPIGFWTEEGDEGYAFSLHPIDWEYTVAAGEALDLDLTPAADLAAGFYEETAVITTSDGEELELKVQLEVLEAERNTLLEITAPQNAGPFPNGTPKSAEGLNLPETVLLVTTWENMEAPVYWDVEDCAYDPEDTQPQEFTVGGEVVLPEDLENPDELSTWITVQVSVEAEKNELICIIEPEEIGPLTNGTEKSVEGLELPENVTIVTTVDEDMTASVDWDVEDCVYTPENPQEQIFTVSGEVDLPEGVENPEEVSTEVNVQVTVGVFEPKEPVLRLTPGDYDFGTLEAEAISGAEAVFKVINDGPFTENIMDPVFYTDRDEPGNAFEAVVRNYQADPGKKMKIIVRPRADLKPGYYSEYAIIPNSAGNDNLILNVCCEIAEPAENVLVKIHKPENITGLPHGSPKTAEGLTLPKTVSIKTTEGKAAAEVRWNVDGCAYDPKLSREQLFDVSGQVVLPEGVLNPGEISLNLTVSVSVKGIANYIAKAENNEVKILSQNTEGSQVTFRFRAEGDGMQQSRPNEGDTRFKPKNWTVQVTKEFNDGYEEEFGLAQPGDYSLDVVFAEQRYDGNAWVDTGRTDTKSRSLHVARKVTETPTATPTPGATVKAAVNTGDDTIILPFIAAGGMALVVLLIVIIILLKRRS